jgi:DNA (cytosine-5)-methyltransferase 1
MRYLSLFSGIEAASAAWHDLGWTPVGFSEIEPFPCAVLAHRFPNVRNYGDVTKYKEWGIEPGSVDLVVGGSPCQAFSVAGLRKGLDDPRGNLTLTYLGVVAHLRPRWVVWENVPGVLSIDGGRVLGAFFGALGQLGYRWAYRVLDAQHFGVPQRRRRIFVVASFGDGPHPGEVLFEPESLRGDSAPRRKTRQKSATAAGASVAGGRDWPAKIAPTLNAAFGSKLGLEDQHALGGAGCFVLSSGQADAAISTTRAHTLTALHEAQVIALPRVPSHWDDPAAPHPTLNQSASGSGGVGCSNQEIFSQRGAYLVPSTQTYSIQDGREINKAQNGLGISDPDAPAYTIDTTGAQSVAICAHPVAFAFAQNTRDEVRLVGGDGQLVGALSAGHGTKQTTYLAQPVVCATDTIPHALSTGSPGGQASIAVAHPVAFTAPAIGLFQQDAIAGTLTRNSGAGGETQNAAFVVQPDMPPTTYLAQPVAVSFEPRFYTRERTGGALTQTPVLTASAGAGDSAPCVAVAHPAPMVVRRLTPMECERLQGFPDDWTAIPYRGKTAPDGPRYKALGNSMAVPVMRWIGQRIAKLGGDS